MKQLRRSGMDGKGTLIATRIVRLKPDWAIVFYRGFPHLLCLRALRRAMLNLALDRNIDSMQQLAQRVKSSRSTVSRFFAGRPTSVPVMLAILDELKLKFEDVCWPLEGELLRRLQEEGTIERSGVTILTIDPLSLPEAAGLREMVQRALPAPLGLPAPRHDGSSNLPASERTDGGNPR